MSSVERRDFSGFEISDVYSTTGDDNAGFKLRPIGVGFAKVAFEVGDLWVRSFSEFIVSSGYSYFIMAHSYREIILQKSVRKVSKHDIEKLNHLVANANRRLSDKLADEPTNEDLNEEAIVRIKGWLGV